MSGPPRCLAKPRGASQCAGVLPPAWGILSQNALTLLFLAYMISRQGYAETVDILTLLLLGGFWGYFSHFFAFVSHFGRILSHHSIFFDVFLFFSIFYRFWMDLGRILGGFWKDFFEVFRFFLKTANFVKYSVLPRKNHYICYVALVKNNKKSTKKHRKSDANLR